MFSYRVLGVNKRKSQMKDKGTRTHWDAHIIATWEHNELGDAMLCYSVETA